MYRLCLRCGLKSRAKVKHVCRNPDCGSYTVGICGITRKLAEQFYKMGFEELSFTEAYMSNVPGSRSDKEIAPHGWKVTTVLIEFSRRYDEICFPELPDIWVYYTDDTADFCRLVYFDHAPDEPQSQREINNELREAVNLLHRWAVRHEATGLHKVHRMAGLT